MKIVRFTPTVNNTANTIELPDDPALFSSMHFDSATGTMEAVYIGTLENLPVLGSKETPKWDADTKSWLTYNDRRYNLTKKEYFLSFTADEYQAIQDAIPTDPLLAQLWNTLQVVDYVNLEDPVTVNGMQYLVSIGLLTSDRYTDIMYGVPQDGLDPALGF